MNNEHSKPVKGILGPNKISKLEDKNIFIYRNRNQKNLEKAHFTNKKPIINGAVKNGTIKNITFKKPETIISNGKKETTKSISNNNISKNSILSNGMLKNSTVKISIVKRSKINSRTIQKCTIKHNPTKKRSIKNMTLQNKINPKTKMNEKSKVGIKDNFKNYIDEEINGLSYNQAILYDKRSYCQYYGSLLKTQHNLICALFNSVDYNLGIIKIDLFLVAFVIEYTVNALFFNDDTMHEIYESKGGFNLDTQLPIIVYSSIISY